MCSTANTASLLEILDLRKRFVAGLGRCRVEVRALDGVTLGAERGDIVGIAGRAGSGKSTLLLCVAGLLRPDGGCIRIAGQPATRADPERARLLAGPLAWRALRDLRSAPNVLLIDGVLETLDPCDRAHASQCIVEIARQGAAVMLAERDERLLRPIGSRIHRLALGVLCAGDEREERLVSAVRVAERPSSGVVKEAGAHFGAPLIPLPGVSSLTNAPVPAATRLSRACSAIRERERCATRRHR